MYAHQVNVIRSARQTLDVRTKDVGVERRVLEFSVPYETYARCVIDRSCVISNLIPIVCSKIIVKFYIVDQVQRSKVDERVRVDELCHLLIIFVFTLRHTIEKHHLRNGVLSTFPYLLLYTIYCVLILVPKAFITEFKEHYYYYVLVTNFSKRLLIILFYYFTTFLQWMENTTALLSVI